MNNNFLQLKNVGFLVVKNLYDHTKLITDIPQLKGKYDYYGKKDKVVYTPEEGQVEGCTSRYNYPDYQVFHNDIRKKIEEILNVELFNTYYFDRFYFVNQKLDRHVDREACEISVSLHINSNIQSSWDFFFMGKDGKEKSVSLNPGDGVIYLGCEVEHWRNSLSSRYSRIVNKVRKYLKMEDDTFYHQIFFHYVLADGNKVQFAFDRNRVS